MTVTYIFIDLQVIGIFLRLSAPRTIVIRKQESGSLGLKANGGNAVGIFVAGVSESAASRGLLRMDQLLEVNGRDVRHATTEEVIMLIKDIGNDQTMQDVTVVVQYNPHSKSGVMHSSVFDYLLVDFIVCH